MDIAVLNIKGEETGRTVALSDEVFAIEPNDHAIYLDVKQYLANQRQGTHKSKERAEITGSTKKIKRQKGTGTARAGSLKSPVFRGGGRAFGPRPRNYGFKLNKKVKQLARKSALSYKIKDSELFVLENLEMNSPKTKEFKSILEGLKLDNKKTLLVLDGPNKNIFLSSRNLKNSNVKTVEEVNTYAILNADSVILAEGSVEKIQTILK